MAESGWLTRSLEQPYPYTLNYQGKINNKAVKEAFLQIIDYVQQHSSHAESALKLLLHEVKNITEASKIKIVKLKNKENLTIETVIKGLEYHFNFNYKTHGSSKLPVLALYAIYQRLIEEVERYKSCTLNPLGSHTASDLTSKTAGDIEIYKTKNLIEAIEIKHGKPIDLHMIQVAKDKIIKFNPRRYYILSSADVKYSEIEQIDKSVQEIRAVHGCQVIVNGIIPTLKYYLRLIMSIETFVESYSKLIESDQEIQAVHKIKWNEILLELE